MIPMGIIEYTEPVHLMLAPCPGVFFSFGPHVSALPLPPSRLPLSDVGVPIGKLELSLSMLCVFEPVAFVPVLIVILEFTVALFLVIKEMASVYRAVVLT